MCPIYGAESSCSTFFSKKVDFFLACDPSPESRETPLLIGLRPFRLVMKTRVRAAKWIHVGKFVRHAHPGNVLFGIGVGNGVAIELEGATFHRFQDGEIFGDEGRASLGGRPCNPRAAALGGVDSRTSGEVQQPSGPEIHWGVGCHILRLPADCKTLFEKIQSHSGHAPRVAARRSPSTRRSQSARSRRSCWGRESGRKMAWRVRAGLRASRDSTSRIRGCPKREQGLPRGEALQPKGCSPRGYSQRYLRGDTAAH